MTRYQLCGEYWEGPTFTEHPKGEVVDAASIQGRIETLEDIVVRLKELHVCTNDGEFFSGIMVDDITLMLEEELCPEDCGLMKRFLDVEG